MHRIATIAGENGDGDVNLVEQPEAPVIFLTSAASDISTLSASIKDPALDHWKNQIRALPIETLHHKYQIDHYIQTTAQKAKIIVVRLLGGKGHWSYGIEQLTNWEEQLKDRKLFLLSGTKELSFELHSLGKQNSIISNKLSELLREGGDQNMKTFLQIIWLILEEKELKPDKFMIEYISDPMKLDWKEENGKKVGIIMYKSLLQSSNTELPIELNKNLRSKGLSPRTLLVSNLKDRVVQTKVLEIFEHENLSLIMTATSFSATNFTDSEYITNIWDKLDKPIFQIITSSKSKDMWIKSSVGLSSQDLGLQIVLPEIDGRISTRPCAFRNPKIQDESISTVITKLEPNKDGIEWVSNHAKSWIELFECNNYDKRICIIIANYPPKNGRLANGVGLDTPASIIETLNLLKTEGYDLGSGNIPKDSKELMNIILNGRTNDPESCSKSSFTYYPLSKYKAWWNKQPKESKEKVGKRWGEPDNACDLDVEGFSIQGISFGKLLILIQPSRGYDPDKVEDIHSPDLPPPHRYLAQYAWIREIYKAHCIIHLGKHGSVEWLPGKGTGISINCFPGINLGYIPHIYPFIVNDPGEGTQAKRRGNAVIIDHLTPPLARSELYGDLQHLEGTLDEYYESKLINSERTQLLANKILNLLKKLNWPGIPSSLTDPIKSKEEIIANSEAYLCELKESQIRTGLHIFGRKPTDEDILKLLLGIIRTPQQKNKGFTQILASMLSLELNPWTDDESEILSRNDKTILSSYTDQRLRIKGHAVDWLESQALIILKITILSTNADHNKKELMKGLAEPLNKIVTKKTLDPVLTQIKNGVWKNLLISAKNEKFSLLKSLNGGRIQSGPSGAPTRGRPDVLPTGRNFFSVDLRGLPTEAAWDLARKSAENLLELHLLEQGSHLKHLALSVWGTATMRNGGEDIAQLLALMGVIPVWDGPSRRVIDLDVIPISVLGRPRVDVTLRISGLFRDAFPNLIDLSYRAQRLIMNLQEEDELNPLAKAYREDKTTARIFGSAPGAYGAGLQELINSSNWNDSKDLASAYISWSQWKYEGSVEPVKDKDSFTKSLKDVEVVLHNQDNREHDILDSDDYYQFHGGLSAAVKLTSNRDPKLLIGDHSRKERPKIRTLEQEIDKVMRSRVLNPIWLKGMFKHGYKGAFEMSASLDYLFAYDAVTDSVPNWCYKSILEEWLNSEDTKNFLLKNNPWALRDIAERLLEASNRKMWSNSSNKDLELLKSIINTAESNIEKDIFE